MNAEKCERLQVNYYQEHVARTELDLVVLYLNKAEARDKMCRAILYGAYTDYHMLGAARCGIDALFLLRNASMKQKEVESTNETFFYEIGHCELTPNQDILLKYLLIFNDNALEKLSKVEK
ncbi:Uncharacterized protein Fot_29712 [Forsythia ovata]|uniref:Uncharacterized protein n=1 Tax=Forsythia ovata TaxID=205694 RepID=A0ABD1TSP1_9LAMI